MEIIETLSDQIHEELHDSKKYVKCAMKHKESMPELAELYYKLSQEEMTHAEALHKQVVSIIEKYRAEHGEPPADMLAVYNYIHKKDMEKTLEIKNLWSMYKE